jgi:hypothetical protein
VAYKKKLKKWIISYWEDYNDNYVSILFFQLNDIYEFIRPKYLLSICMTDLRTLFAT